MVNTEIMSELQEEFTAKLLLLQCYACVIKKKGKCLHGYDELRVILRTSLGSDFKRSLPKWGKFAYSPPGNCKGGTTLFFVSLLELAHYTQAIPKPWQILLLARPVYNLKENNLLHTYNMRNLLL